MGPLGQWRIEQRTYSVNIEKSFDNESNESNFDCIASFGIYVGYLGRTSHAGDAIQFRMQF